MENVGENFANSCRREDKMRREGGRDSFEEKEEEQEEEEHKSGDSNYTQDIAEKERGKKEEEEHKSGDSNYCQDMSQEKKEGKISWIFFVAREGMQDEPRWVQRSSGSDSSSQKPRCQS